MENLQQLMERWGNAPVQMTPLEQIYTDDALQPRKARAVPVKSQDKNKARMAAHVKRMAGHLTIDPSQELDPIWLVQIDEDLFMVDGHHRMLAYIQTERTTIPARIGKVSKLKAEMVSKIVNCGHRSEPMEPAQCIEACWQFLGLITYQGRMRVPKEYTCEKLRAMFTIGSTSTVHSMTSKLTWTHEQLTDSAKNELSDGHIDPDSGWPYWKYARSYHMRNLEGFDADEQQRKRTAKFEGNMWKMHGQDPVVVFKAIGNFLGEWKDGEEPDGYVKMAIDCMEEATNRAATKDAERTLKEQEEADEILRREPSRSTDLEETDWPFEV